MISYSLTEGKHGEIIFQTNCEELKADIRKYIINCADAIRWRKELKKVIHVYSDEGGE